MSPLSDMLSIQSWPKNMSDLSVFSNLRTIQGRRSSRRYSMYFMFACVLYDWVVGGKKSFFGFLHWKLEAFYTEKRFGHVKSSHCCVSFFFFVKLTFDKVWGIGWRLFKAFLSLYSMLNAESPCWSILIPPITQGLLSSGDKAPLFDLPGVTLVAQNKRRRRVHHRKRESLLPWHHKLDPDLG